MDINTKLTLVVAFLFATTISSTCRKGPICSDTNTYAFLNNYAKAYPDRDSIRIGDTIWIEITIPTTLRDALTNKLIDFSDAVSLGNTFAVGRFTGGSISDPGGMGAVNKFNYAVTQGQLSSIISTERIQFTFANINNFFSLKVGVIAKDTGNYSIAISDDAGVHKKNANCEKASFGFLFANTNQHLYFYQDNRPGYTISDYERQHMYCFKVY